ncbi:MAG: tetratricopeptide repeat protein [Phycisphaeraceae bacterium]|nr:tetratricopeptide repeat protein [Phycisphaerae bacterium]MBX3391951.1 tetratricopeptide repeat protein [Phycisphaeraceae bacterium]
MSRLQAMLSTVEQALAGGRFEEARQTLMRALQRDPSNGPLCNAMAVTLVMLRQHEQALFYAQRAAKALPDDGEAASTLGSILALLGRAAEAVPVLERAIALSPRSPNPRLGIANALGSLNRHSEVVEHCRAGLAVAPDDQDLTVKLTFGLLSCGQADEAVAFSGKALERRPDDSVLASWRAFALNYLPDPDPAQVRSAHEQYGRLVETAHPPRPQSPPREPARPGGSLRVGLVSPDFRTHSVAYFVEPLLRHLDRDRVEVTCYSTSKTQDQTTRRLKDLAAHWRPCAGLADAALADRIRSDRIDILFDLAGHTSDNSLPVFAMRPAPIQATWCGYPATTGLTAIDWRLVDSITDPAGSESHCVEKIMRMDPCFLCYQPPDASPPVGPSPAEAAGHVTFGSFNTLLKLNTRVVETWARILRETPGSKLMLKATQLADSRVRGWTVDRFAAAGIDPARIDVLEATASQHDHLALYHRMDIALDPFPYAGTTTTCEAMWMGVPVVTLAGRSHAGRVGLSLLSAVGMDELAAPDVDSYVALAVGLAGDRARTASLRASTRDRVASSVLCDGPAFAGRFESALHAMVRGG